jgi:hypothetical protein
MPNFTWFFRLFQHSEGCEQHGPLTFVISDFAERPAIGVFDGGRAGYADGAMKIMSGCKDDCRNLIFLQ